MAYFDTTEYEAAHARKPRGYGMWAFHVRAFPCPDRHELVFSPVMSYARAKAWLQRRYGKNLLSARVGS